MLLTWGLGEDSWESLGLQGDPTINPKGNQSWIFIGRTDAEAETPILWPPDAKSWLIGEDSDAGRDWGQEEKGTTEDEIVGWHYWLNGYDFEQAAEVGDGQGNLVCCSPWSRQESDMTEQLNWTKYIFKFLFILVRYSASLIFPQGLIFPFKESLIAFWLQPWQGMVAKSLYWQ